MSRIFNKILKCSHVSFNKISSNLTLKDINLKIDKKSCLCNIKLDKLLANYNLKAINTKIV